MFFTLFVSCLAAVWLLTVAVAFYPARWVPARLRQRSQAKPPPGAGPRALVNSDESTLTRGVESYAAGNRKDRRR